ncbi:MAG TPA: hypothetical protein VG755_33940 [Nannocystaceae bacterium]|nr:hypothetical protein [Nannocystaceae bacterium]
MRVRLLGLAVVVLACGPTVGTPHDDGGGSGESGATTTTTSGATISTTSGPPSSDATTSTTSVPTDESSIDSGADTFDVGVLDTGDDPPPDPPRGCDLPDNPNSDVSGTTLFGEATFTAAAFANTGGGKCPHAFRVVLASDPDALAAGVAMFDNGGFPGALVVELVIPDGEPTPGEWSGAMMHYENGQSAISDVTADVMIVPDYHSPQPLLQFDVVALDPEWTMGGHVTAHYCDEVAGGACGA